VLLACSRDSRGQSAPQSLISKGSAKAQQAQRAVKGL
jgi:hypothetical protein